MPAIITLAIVSATMQTLAMSLVIAREDGRLKRGRGTPMPAWVFIAGRIGNSIVVALLMLVLLAAIGRLLYGVPIPWEPAAGDLLVVLVVGAASFCCLGIALTALIPSQDAAAPIVNALLLPLYFLSGVFIPEDELPDGVIDFADHLPGPATSSRRSSTPTCRAAAPARRLGQPRGRRALGGRRPRSRDPLLPLDARAAAERADRPTFRAVRV